ncbi:MAG: Ubiquinone biosynthesis O-methyltransferase [Holosporales bacterium]
MDASVTETHTPEQITLNPEEVRRFDEQTNDWWSKKGPLGPLLDLNPLRLTFIQDQLTRAFNLESPISYAGLDILDVGCGAGLISEPMARLGAKVTGIDASETALTQARIHALQENLDICYKQQTIEQQLLENQLFDVVIALDVVEHVDHVDAFLKACVGLLKPNGVFILSTLNRTVSSYLKAIILAEYILKWVPPKTHNWYQFLKPSEIAQVLQSQGCFLTQIKGISLNPITNEWSLTQKLDTNYILAAKNFT